jgi:hypothetical protein
MSDIGLHDLDHLRGGTVECMMGVLGRYLDLDWFYFRLVSGVGGVKFLASIKVHNCSSV